MLGVGALAVALILFAVGFVIATGEPAPRDKAGKPVGPSTPGNPRAAIIPFIAAAVCAAAGAYLLAGGRWS